MRCALLVVLAACPHNTIVEPPIARPAEGISIAIYQPSREPSFAVVDDRSWLEVANGSVTLDRIDPAAALPSLVIEPLDGEPFGPGACTRERLEPAAPVSPIVRCAVTAKPGKHFVRVLHIAPSLAFKGRHTVTLDGERASIVSRYAITLPSWRTRGTVALYDGNPGTGDPPIPITRGAVVLDGNSSILTVPVRTVPARIRRVYDGAVREPDQRPIDPAWGRESRRAVFVVLELDDAKLPTGALEVRAGLPDETARDVIVTEPDRELVGSMLRVPLWIDDTLHGVRRSDVDAFPGPRGRVIQQRIDASVSNSSDTARDVWIEERLRPGLQRDVRGTPVKPAIEGDFARVKLTVPPHGTERVSYTIRYEL